MNDTRSQGIPFPHGTPRLAGEPMGGRLRRQPWRLKAVRLGRRSW